MSRVRVFVPKRSIFGWLEEQMARARLRKIRAVRSRWWDALGKAHHERLDGALWEAERNALVKVGGGV